FWQTVSTRIGSLMREPVRIWPSSIWRLLVIRPAKDVVLHKDRVPGLPIDDLDGPCRLLAAHEVFRPAPRVDAGVDQLGAGVGFRERHDGCRASPTQCLPGRVGMCLDPE